MIDALRRQLISLFWKCLLPFATAADRLEKILMGE
jgi:hypothetical protein